MIDLLKFVLVGFLISIPIGPTTFLSFQRVLKYGFKAGLFTSLGLISADLVDSLITISDVPFIKTITDEYGVLLKTAGFVLILIISITTYRSKINLNIEDNIPNKNLLSFFFGIFIYALIHPASLFLFLSLNASDLITADNKILFPIGLIIGELLWWIPLNLIFNKFRNRINSNYLSIINKSTSILLVILSALILLV